METTNTTATTLAENTDWITGGNISQIPASLAVVKPMPMDKDSAAMVIFL